MAMSVEQSVTPSRAVLADAALKAATELGILLNNGEGSRIDQITRFRDVLHQTTGNWLDDAPGRQMDASAARLYLQAVQQSHGGVPNSPKEFLATMRGVLKDFDDIQTTQSNPEALRAMLQFALALHTLLIRDSYNRLAHWKHRQLI